MASSYCLVSKFYSSPVSSCTSAFSCQCAKASPTYQTRQEPKTLASHVTITGESDSPVN